MYQVAVREGESIHLVPMMTSSAYMLVYVGFDRSYRRERYRGLFQCSYETKTSPTKPVYSLPQSTQHYRNEFQHSFETLFLRSAIQWGGAIPSRSNSCNRKESEYHNT